MCQRAANQSAFTVQNRQTKTSKKEKTLTYGLALGLGRVIRCNILRAHLDANGTGSRFLGREPTPFYLQQSIHFYLTVTLFYLQHHCAGSITRPGQPWAAPRLKFAVAARSMSIDKRPFQPRLCVNRTNGKDSRVRLTTSSQTIGEDSLKPKPNHNPNPNPN